jgi:hypothetical protein
VGRPGLEPPATPWLTPPDTPWASVSLRLCRFCRLLDHVVGPLEPTGSLRGTWRKSGLGSAGILAREHWNSGLDIVRRTMRQVESRGRWICAGLVVHCLLFHERSPADR